MPTLYFAYGSNMSTARLRDRVPSVAPLGPARLTGWAWRCDKRGADGTAKANLAREAAAETWGVLYAIDGAELPALDRAEGGYERVTVEVERDAARVEALTYVSSRVASDWKPAPWYLALVVAGAREHGLPEAWIAALEKRATEARARGAAAQPGDASPAAPGASADHCFGCSPHNPRGLALVFDRIATGVVETRYVAPSDLCGMDGVVHGGVQAAMLDEAMGFAVHAAFEDGDEAHVATVELSLRYRRPAPTGQPLAIRAEFERAEGRDVWVRGTIRDATGRLCTEAASRWRRLRA